MEEGRREQGEARRRKGEGGRAKKCERGCWQEDEDAFPRLCSALQAPWEGKRGLFQLLSVEAASRVANDRDSISRQDLPAEF